MDAVPLTSAGCNGFGEPSSVERPRAGPTARGLGAALALAALLSLLVARLPRPAGWGGARPQEAPGARLWESGGPQGTDAQSLGPAVPLALLRESRQIRGLLPAAARESGPLRGLPPAAAPQKGLASAWPATPPKLTPIASGDPLAASQQLAVPEVALAAPLSSPAATPAVLAIAPTSTALPSLPATPAVGQSSAWPAPSPAADAHAQGSLASRTPRGEPAMPLSSGTAAPTSWPTPCLVFEGWRLAPATVASGAYAGFSWEACLEFCAADEDCQQVSFSKEGRTCQPGSSVTLADVDDRGGFNSGFVSAHCPVGSAPVQTNAAQAPATAVPPPETSSRATTRAQQLAGSSLFCVTLFAPGQGDLVQGHMVAGVGVFGCDDYALYSSSAGKLGDADVRVLDVDPLALTSPSRPASAGAVFVALWKAVVADGAFRAQGWTVRSDPDCLLLPERLRGVIRARALAGASGSASPRASLVACPDLPWAPLEVLSSAAVEAVERCGMACGPGGVGRLGGLEVSLAAAQVVAERRDDLLGAGGCAGADKPDAYRCSGREAAFYPQGSAALLQDCLRGARAADAALPVSPENLAQYERTWRQ